MALIQGGGPPPLPPGPGAPRAPREPWGGRADRAPPPAPEPAALRRALLLTRLGLGAERALRAFWPLWTVLAALLAFRATGWGDALSLDLAWWATVLAALAAAAALGWGLWRFRLPTALEARERLDATMPGRPLAALADAQAMGRDDAASRALWDAHRARMAARAARARAPRPDPALAARDPYGLRYMAGIGLAAALLFGGAWRAVEAPALPGGPGAALASGPAWEGWIEPPAYTGKPALYLADLAPGPIEVPAGSQVTIRLYGEVGALSVEEGVSGTEASDPTAPEQGFAVREPGRLAIEGEGGAAWEVTLLPDAPPAVEATGPVEASGEGEMSLPFKASDDYGVQRGTATVALDLGAVDRRFGLAPEPDAREALVLDLPMPFGGDRALFEERLADDLSEHPFANLPVTVTLSVEDAAGQAGAAEPIAMTLPGRRFFQPVARAVAEQRRDLLWSRANAPRVVDLLRAIAWKPEDLFPDRALYLRLSYTIRRLAEQEDALSPERQEEMAKALWDLAVLLEEGTLRDARERLARAQERLEEAMRNGASPAEIAELMQELREATDDYMQMLADQMQPSESGVDQPQSAQQQGMEVTQDEIQALMDRIQELMEEGRMAEAQELMDQLNELMANLQMVEGEGGGNGPRRPGQQSMEDLQDSLREQQDLSDEAFRDLQEQFGDQPGRQGQQPGQQGRQPGQQPGPQGQQGQPGDQPGQPGGRPGQPGGEQGGAGRDGEGGRDPGSLADRQEALRREIERQQGELPGLTGEAAEAARGALGRAEEAMDGAEQALREGDLGEAIDRQADAMDALREGLRQLGQALAEQGGQSAGPEDFAGQGEQGGGRPTPGGRRDPLGRQLGEGGSFGSDQTLAEREDVYRRAEELLGEIRKRLGEQERPRIELDYLRRLLEQF